MDNFEEVIFDDDEFLDDSPEIHTENLNFNETSFSNDEKDDLTNEVLRLKGISDPSKIKFEDESGAVIERSWDTLSRDEQINILAHQERVEDELTDEEINLLNSIRNSGMSVNDYIQSIQQPQEEPVRSYKIDQLSDEDVYALDLLEKVGSDNITDEEIEEAINNAKQNPTLFNKTVEGLRKEYIRLQQDDEAQLANEIAAQKQAAYNQFATSITNEIRGLNSFAGQDLELSDDDSDELAEFMLRLDDKGISAFGYALQDPKLFTKAAFWLLNEELIVEELTKLMLDNYKRGYEAAKKDLQGDKSTLAFAPKPQPKSTEVFNTFVDDEEW